MRVKNVTQEYLKNGYFYPDMVDAPDQEKLKGRMDLWTLTRDICRLSEGELKIVRVREQGETLWADLGIQCGLPVIALQHRPLHEKPYMVGNEYLHLKKRGQYRFRVESQHPKYLLTAIAGHVKSICENGDAAWRGQLQSVFEHGRSAVEEANGSPWSNLSRRLDADSVMEMLEVIEGKKNILNISQNTRYVIVSETNVLNSIFLARANVMAEIFNYFGKEKLAVGASSLGIIVGAVRYSTENGRNFKNFVPTITFKLYKNLARMREREPEFGAEVEAALLLHKLSRESKPYNHIDKDKLIPHDGLFEDTHSISWCSSAAQPSNPQWFLMDRAVLE